MVEKLHYLEKLKNNMGEEMADMMSEEITKVMEEQHQIELEYAQLVEQRDQLKGITNKQRLEETKQDIMVSALHNGRNYMTERLRFPLFMMAPQFELHSFVTLIPVCSVSPSNLRTALKSCAVSCRRSLQLSIIKLKSGSTKLSSSRPRKM